LIRDGEVVAVHKGRFIRAVLASGVHRSGIPGGRHHGLVVGDFAVIDDDPVAKRPARAFDGADAADMRRPA